MESLLSKLRQIFYRHELRFVKRWLWRGRDLDKLPVIILLRANIRLGQAGHFFVNLCLVHRRVLNDSSASCHLLGMLQQVSVQVVHVAFAKPKLLVFTDEGLAEAKFLQQVVVGNELFLLLVNIDGFPVLALAAHRNVLNSHADTGPVHIIALRLVVRG